MTDREEKRNQKMQDERKKMYFSAKAKAVSEAHKNEEKEVHKHKYAIYDKDFKHVSEKEAEEKIKAGTHRFHEPSHQGSSKEEEQVGIKHN